MALDGVGIAAIVGAGLGGVATIIGAIRVQGGAARREDEKGQPRPSSDDRPPIPPVPTSFDGDQILKFLEIQRLELVDLRERDVQKDVEIAGLKIQLSTMGVDLRTSLDVNSAFGRWIPIIYRWGTGGATGSFPLPSTPDDMVLLRDFIPRG